MTSVVMNTKETYVNKDVVYVILQQKCKKFKKNLKIVNAK